MKRGKILVGFTLVFALIFALIEHQKVEKLKGQVAAQRALILQKEEVIDSLYGEAFNMSTQLGRVELTLDHLREVAPGAYLEFSHYYDHETE